VTYRQQVEQAIRDIASSAWTWDEILSWFADEGRPIARGTWAAWRRGRHCPRLAHCELILELAEEVARSAAIA